jgi:hypothetical protein
MVTLHEARGYDVMINPERTSRASPWCRRKRMTVRAHGSVVSTVKYTWFVNLR